MKKSVKLLSIILIIVMISAAIGTIVVSAAELMPALENVNYLPITETISWKDVDWADSYSIDFFKEDGTVVHYSIVYENYINISTILKESGRYYAMVYGSNLGADWYSPAVKVEFTFTQKACSCDSLCKEWEISESSCAICRDAGDISVCLGKPKLESNGGVFMLSETEAEVGFNCYEADAENWTYHYMLGTYDIDIFNTEAILSGGISGDYEHPGTILLTDLKDSDNYIHIVLKNKITGETSTILRFAIPEYIRLEITPEDKEDFDADNNSLFILAGGEVTLNLSDNGWLYCDSENVSIKPIDETENGAKSFKVNLPNQTAAYTFGAEGYGQNADEFKITVIKGYKLWLRYTGEYSATLMRTYAEGTEVNLNELWNESHSDRTVKYWCTYKDGSGKVNSKITMDRDYEFYGMPGFVLKLENGSEFSGNINGSSFVIDGGQVLSGSTIDLSGITGANSLQFGSGAISGGSEDLSIKYPNGATVTVPSGAQQDLAGAAGDNQIRLETSYLLSPENAAGVKSNESVLGAFSINAFILNGNESSHYTIESPMEYTVPVSGDIDAENVKVYRVNEDGSRTKMSSTVNSDGTVSFSTPGTSDYIIVVDNGLPTGALIAIIAGAVAIAGICIALAVVMVKKRKKA